MAARMLQNEEEAKDAVQDIMIKLWDKRKQLALHPNLTGFVFLTARNHCLDCMKKKKHEQSIVLYPNLIADIQTEQNQNELKELHEIIRQIIVNLPENQQEVLLMHDLDGFEVDEISSITDLKPEHIRVLLSRARKYIRIQLETTYNYEEDRSRKAVKIL